MNDLAKLQAENGRLKKLISAAKQYQLMPPTADIELKPKAEMALSIKNLEARNNELQRRVYELEATLREIWHTAERTILKTKLSVAKSRGNRL